MSRLKGSKDKKKRNHGGGMPKKAASDKAKKHSYSVYDDQQDFINQNFGSGTKAIKSLLPKKLKR